MSEIVTLHGAEPEKVLQAFVEKKIPAAMSYLSKGKWHTVKVVPTALGVEKFSVSVSPRKKSCPMNISIEQPVGVSLKYEYGRFVFETKVVAFETMPETSIGGMIILAIPDRIGIVQRRSYYRVEVPKSLKVNVTMWHRNSVDGNKQTSPARYWQGRLVDISAGGAQISVDAGRSPDFRKGQFIGLRFTPMPYETPLLFSAQVRSILPTVDEKNICFGIKIVGLEASAEGREVLYRLVGIVQRYYQMNHSADSLQNAQPSEV